MLAGVGLICLTVSIVRQLKGGLLAQGLAGLAVLFAGIYLSMSSALTMDPFNELWWASVAWVTLRLLIKEDPRQWLWFGVIAGFGLMTKVTMAFYCFALVLGILLSPKRRLHQPLIYKGVQA